MLTATWVKKILRGYYPNTTLLTTPILEEMVEILSSAGCDEAMFTKILRAYRTDPLRGETNTERVPPTFGQLRDRVNRWNERARPTPINEIHTASPPPAWWAEYVHLMAQDDHRGAYESILNNPESSPTMRARAQKWLEGELRRPRPRGPGPMSKDVAAVLRGEMLQTEIGEGRHQEEVRAAERAT